MSHIHEGEYPFPRKKFGIRGITGGDCGEEQPYSEQEGHRHESGLVEKLSRSMNISKSLFPPGLVQQWRRSMSSQVQSSHSKLSIETGTLSKAAQSIN